MILSQGFALALSSGLSVCTTMVPVTGLISKPTTRKPALIAARMARVRSDSLKLTLPLTASYVAGVAYGA